jgi:transcriptional regulator with XRE-family HTH domain
MLDSSRIRLGRELREARESSGLSLRDLGQAVSISHSQASRIERGLVHDPSLRALTRMAAAVGLEMSIRLYPVGDPLRDVAHSRLLDRFRSELHPSLTIHHEVPFGRDHDLRAWDAVVSGAGWRVAVEAETRLADVQALVRRISLKKRDGGIATVILVIADTRGNRAAKVAARGSLAAEFPISGRAVLAALRAGESPSGSGVIVL